MGPRYIVQPDVDGAKPLSEIKYNVVDTKTKIIVNRVPTELLANNIANHLNTAWECL